MSDSGAIFSSKHAISRSMLQIQFYRLRVNPPRYHQNRLNMPNPGQEALSCEITLKNLFLRYLADSGPILRRKHALSRPSRPIQFYRPHGSPTTHQTQRLKWLNPGQDGISEKLLVKNLILRHEAEIDAFWGVNLRSLDSVCKFSSIDCTPLQVGCIESEWTWEMWGETLWTRRYVPPKASRGAILGSSSRRWWVVGRRRACILPK